MLWPTRRKREVFQDVLRKLLETEFRQYCRDIEQIYSEAVRELGRAFTFEVAAYLLFRLDYVMFQFSIPDDQRDAILTVSQDALLGKEAKALFFDLVDSRIAGYSEVVRGQKEPGQWLLQCTKKLKTHLDASPDQPEDVKAEHPLVIGNGFKSFPVQVVRCSTKDGRLGGGYTVAADRSVRYGRAQTVCRGIQVTGGSFDC